MTLARNNRITPDALRGMAARSWAELQAVLGPPRKNGDELDAELLRDIELAIDQ